MKRRTFIASLLALLATPVAWAFPKKKEPTYSFKPEDVQPWLKRCPGCGDFFNNLVRTEYPETEVPPGYVYAIYDHHDGTCGVIESKFTPGYYTITSVKNGPSEYEGYGPYVGDKIKIG